ncbi:MAG TPA: hypothetical protein VJJ79_02915, partial [Candidatus Nanoarchaeia archaeon]|nr:hypothetical protein [Candidatus Nanoarchaeia archaeon]
MTNVDLHRYDQRLACQVKNVEKAPISRRNKELIFEFQRYCVIQGMSRPRIIKYLEILKTTALILGKDFDEVTKEDIMGFVQAIQQQDYSPWTKQTYKVMIKRFYKWFKGNNEPPTLSDLLQTLESMEKRATVIEKSSLHSLINRLSIYVDGVFSFLNKHTNINFGNTFVCFDIGDIPRPVKPVIMFLVLDYVYMKMRENIERKILLIDEAWSLLSRTEDASYIFEIVKTCRKFNLGLLLINQEVEGLLTSEAGKSVLANSAYTVLMKQKPAVIYDVCKTFHLSHVEKEYLLTAAVGEGILIIDNDHFELKVVASEEEHKLITTNPDELLKGQTVSKSTEQHTTKKETPKSANEIETEKQQQKVTINVDSEKGFYKHRDLNLDEIKYLLAKKYLIVEKKSIALGKVEKFLLKPRFNESINHFFVTKDIAQYLEQHGIKVEMFATKKPDITFTLHGKKIAIEVETGTVYEKARKQLLEKVNELNKGYDVWFFVVTNRNYAQKYRKLGKTIEMR